MATTIQVEDSTLQILRIIKEETNSKTYNEAIRKLAETKMKIPTSMFGKHVHFKSFTKKDEADFNEL